MRESVLQPMLQMRPLLLLACALALSGCAYVIRDREQVLTGAGFIAQPADTPERQAMLASLPPHAFVRNVEGTQVTYTWADPLVCDCLWIGSAQSYEAYWRLLSIRSGPNTMGGLQGGGPFKRTFNNGQP